MVSTGSDISDPGQEAFRRAMARAVTGEALDALRVQLHNGATPDDAFRRNVEQVFDLAIAQATPRVLGAAVQAPWSAILPRDTQLHYAQEAFRIAMGQAVTSEALAALRAQMHVGVVPDDAFRGRVEQVFDLAIGQATPAVLGAVVDEPWSNILPRDRQIHYTQEAFRIAMGQAVTGEALAALRSQRQAGVANEGGSLADALGALWRQLKAGVFPDKGFRQQVEQVFDLAIAQATPRVLGSVVDDPWSRVLSRSAKQRYTHEAFRIAMGQHDEMTAFAALGWQLRAGIRADGGFRGRMSRVFELAGNNGNAALLARRAEMVAARHLSA